MTSTSNPDFKLFKAPSQEDFEPSNISPFNPSPELDVPSSNLAFDSHPSTSLFSGNNRILINNSNRGEPTARFNEGIPQNRTRTSISIARKQGRASRRFANGGGINLSLNRDISVFTEATLADEFKEEGSEGVSAVATPTSGVPSLKRTSKRKSNSNMSIIHPFATEDDEEEIDLFEDRKKIEKEKRKSKRKIIVEKILESMAMNIVVGIVTIFALFADDVRALVGSWILDWIFDVVTLITFAIFAMEIGFSLYVEEGYLWSMFFWLDIFSTASLIFDVEFLIEDVIPDQANHSTQVAEASRASRIATKQGRVIRIIRLAQLGKLYKQINKNKVENIQKEFAAQKEANFLRQQTLNFQRQTTLLQKQKSFAKIHPEVLFRPASRTVNERHGAAQGPETKRLLAKTDEIIFDPDQATPVLRKGRKKTTFRFQTQPLDIEEVLKESGIRPGTSQGEEVISQPFDRKRMIKSTLLGSKNSGINLLKVISKENNMITEQDQPDITISQPFDRKRTIKNTILGSNHSGISLSKDQKPKKTSNGGGLKESKTLKWQMSDRSETTHQDKEGMAELAPKELRIGRRLTELTTKRVVFMSLALLIIIPLCNADFYFSAPESQEYEMELLGELIDDSGVASATVDLAIENFISELSSHHHEPRLVYLKIGTIEYYKDEHLDLEHVKSSGTSTVTILTKNKGEITSIMSIEDEEKIEAWLSIGKIIFICGLLTIAAVLFSKDTDRMILRPLERIVVKMNRLARDPLQAKKHDLITGNHHEGFENETIKIENAIVKIGHLLAIGYGELGSRIITHNVSSVEDIASSTLIGEKQAAIFGFCKINNFVEITESLQEDVVIFVNSVADIVHSFVDAYQGSVSKNLGDAFFVVWKFPEEDVLDHMDGQIEILNSEQTESLVDCALFSFLKIFAKIHRDPTLNEYKRNESLGIKMPNFETSISLALHAGWAYEGAIGSEYKIDASYVSSDVQIVARLTSAAKKYKVPLVITESVYLLLSEKVKKYARLIDTVLVKEATEPMDLYTIDVDLEGIEMSEDRRKVEKEFKKKKQEKKKKYIKGVVNKGEISDFLTQDTEIEYMLLRKYDEKFVEMFDSAMDSYFEGEWKLSHERLLKGLEMKGNDGPSLSLIDFIEKKHKFVVPEDFQGYRDFKDI